MLKELSKIKDLNKYEDDGLEEYSFIATCLEIGLSIEDLKYFQYVDVMKILLCRLDNSKKNKTRKATQDDIDKFFGG